VKVKLIKLTQHRTGSICPDCHCGLRHAEIKAFEQAAMNPKYIPIWKVEFNLQ